MRTNNKLYKILSEEIKDRNYHNEGLCNNVNRIYMNNTITIQESEKLFRHMRKNAPILNSQTLFKEQGFWWPRTEKGWEQRREFIQKMIKIT